MASLSVRDRVERLREERPDKASSGKQAAVAPAEPTSLLPTEPLPARPEGPYDISERRTEDLEGYLDVGSLLVPSPPSVGVTVLVEQGVPSEIHVSEGPWQLRLSVFAAPRRRATWPDTAAEMERGLRQSGAVVRTGTSSYGPLLDALVRSGEGTVSIRALGVDGPGWLLRVVIQGPFVADVHAVPALGEDTFDDDGAQPRRSGVGTHPVLPLGPDGLPAGALGDVARSAVVRRGEDPMPIGTRLPLTIDPVLLGADSPSDTPRPASRFSKLPA